jgi:Arc/MetJ family transcription regulator
MHKTTIDLPDDLVAAAQRRAREQGTTFRALVIAGLKHVLSASKPRRPYRMPDRRVGNPKDRFQPAPGIDVHDWDAVRALLYEGRGG